MKNLLRLNILLCALFLQSVTGQPLLSRLQATKDAPIYTTYAAARERSEFIIDEGYQLIWTDPAKPILFGSDHGGYLSFAVKKNGQIHHNLNQYIGPPIISTSYADLVRFASYPFPKLRMEELYLVRSSRQVVCDLTLTNESDSTANISLYSLYQLPADSLRKVEVSGEHDALVFSHRETADGWIAEHLIPFVTDRLNTCMLDTTFTAFGAYTSIGQPSLQTLSRTASNVCVEWGEVHHADGTLCTHPVGLAAQVVYLVKGPGQILTEAAPKWGDPDPNIPGNGYQGCELANLSGPTIAEGDSFSVMFTCLSTGQQGVGRGVIPALPAPGGVRVDITLGNTQFLTPPQLVKATFAPGNQTATVSWWHEDGRIHDVYRRRSDWPGRFIRIAEGLIASPFLDMSISADSTYAYIVLDHEVTGRRSTHSLESGNIAPPATTFCEDAVHDNLSGQIPIGDVHAIALQKNMLIPAHGTGHVRLVRGLTEVIIPPSVLLADSRTARSEPIEPYLAQDETDYRRVPSFVSSDSDAVMLYWNAFTLLRQCMLPPEGQLSHNYYVFSREPQWGWGHGGQVFHESLSMLAYALMDPEGAMNSQRVFIERQADNGYINYRTGPYLDETIPYNSELTSSAPWFNWENFEIYRITRDRTFLADAYQSGTKFYNFWDAERDKNRNGLCEWGGHGVLESVRDGQTVVWEQVGWPSNFEALDLNCLLVGEAEALAGMARELGDSAAAQSWQAKASARSTLVNSYMWDPATGFYYNIDRFTKTFSFSYVNDLKRKEIIGFLPLWAGVASTEQAAKLVQHLTNPAEFWRQNGVPSLSADDYSYTPNGYWNGPVWVQWQFLIFRGLLRYGYIAEARALAAKVSQEMIRQLKGSHWFWELYSPDADWAGWNKTYIWAGIVARMLLDVQELPVGVEETKRAVPTEFRLEQNYPNPFNPVTVIKYTVGVESGRRQVAGEAGAGGRESGVSKTSLVVYDVLGRQVATLVDEVKAPGSYEVRFDGRGLASGIYIYRLTAGSFAQVRTMLLIK